MPGLPCYGPNSEVVVQLLPATPGKHRPLGYGLLSISLLFFKAIANRKRRLLLAYGFIMKANDILEGWQYAQN